MPKLPSRVTDPAPRTSRTAPAPVLGTLLAEFVDRAFAVAACLTRDSEAAARLVQDAALAASHDFSGRDPSCDFRIWFLTLVVHEYLAMRSAGVLVPAPEADLDDTPDLYLYARLAGVGALEDGPDPAASLFDRLGSDRLMLALDRLPEEYRLVTVLYYFEDLDYEALAAITRQPVGAVRARLHRGRKMLQRAVWDMAGGRDVASGEGDASR